MTDLLLDLGRLCSGLLAGLYLGFAIAVVPALRRTSGQVYVEVMSKIEKVIASPFFLVLFLGTPLFSLALLLDDPSPGRGVVAGFAVASTVITFAAHFPMNRAVVAAAATAAAEEVRDRVERPWARWHLVRTVATTCCFVGLLLPGYPP